MDSDDSYGSFWNMTNPMHYKRSENDKALSSRQESCQQRALYNIRVKMAERYPYYKKQYEEYFKNSIFSKKE